MVLSALSHEAEPAETTASTESPARDALTARVCQASNRAGIASGASSKSTRPVARALRGMPSNWQVWGLCTITIPPSALMARSPTLPSLPVPESTIPMARSRWSRASESKKKSIGSRWPRAAAGSSRCRAPFTKAMSRPGGMM